MKLSKMNKRSFPRFKDNNFGKISSCGKMFYLNIATKSITWIVSLIKFIKNMTLKIISPIWRNYSTVPQLRTFMEMFWCAITMNISRVLKSSLTNPLQFSHIEVKIVSVSWFSMTMLFNVKLFNMINFIVSIFSKNMTKFMIFVKVILCQLR